MAVNRPLPPKLARISACEMENLCAVQGFLALHREGPVGPECLRLCLARVGSGLDRSAPEAACPWWGQTQSFSPVKGLPKLPAPQILGRVVDTILGLVVFLPRHSENASVHPDQCVSLGWEATSCDLTSSAAIGSFPCDRLSLQKCRVFISPWHLCILLGCVWGSLFSCWMCHESFQPVLLL